MSLANPFGLLLSALRGRLKEGRLDYLSPADARRQLVLMAGEDLGDDPRKWLEWMVRQGYLKPGEYRIDEE
jgi:hypothetical protein